MKRSLRLSFCAAATAAVSLIALGASGAPEDYAKKLTLTVNPARVGADTASVSNVPVAVRLSSSIAGFSYADFLVTNGGDLLFTDDAGNVLSHEIEFWDATGESIVWVKMPSFGPGQKIYAYYGGPANAQNAAGVWGAYVGVWHMAQTSGDVADSTGHGLDASPAGDDTTQSIATAGPVGNGRVNATDGSANRLEVPYDAQLNLGNTLSFSGWATLYGKHDGGRMVIVTRKYKLWNDGWNVSILQDSSDDIGYWGAYNNDWGCLAALNVPDLLQNWVHVTVTYNGTTGYIYINGQRWTSVRQSDWTSNTWIESATDTDQPLTFGYTGGGNWDDGWSRPFKGAFDEFRLSDGVLDADRVKAEYAAQMPDALLYSVGSMAAGEATLLSATTYSMVSADGHNTLTVTGNVTSVLGGSAKVFLAVGMAEPKDGDPAALMAGVATNTVTAGGETVFTWDGALLGTRVAFAVMNVVEAGGSVQTNASATTILTLEDPATYSWIDNGVGVWSDSSKWSSSVNDGIPRLGYPSYGSKFDIIHAQTAVIDVDAEYSLLQGGANLGWENASVTLHGTSDNAAIIFKNDGSGFNQGQYNNIPVVLDNVRISNLGSYHVKAGSSLTMLNGASITTLWEFEVIGANASLFVGDGCEIVQRGGDGIGFGFGGENASVTISNGTIRAYRLCLGAHGKNPDSNPVNVGETPTGFRFEGESPLLSISSYPKVYADMGNGCPFVFSIPADGFNSAPIVKAGTSNHPFAEKASSGLADIAFSIDKNSPFFREQSLAKLTQPLVNWTYNGTAYGINEDSVTLNPTAKAAFTITPEEAATKSGIVAELNNSLSTVILFR